ncbi:protein OSCP1-like [Sycon ciliatum]|uniref:protein OSCP1-like n=1 Tax=Sycon ciliatum TaxID=27933 RepID=UPI0020A8BD7C
MAEKAKAVTEAAGSESSSGEDSDGETETSLFSPYLSANALPLLYTNLAGEMVYVLSTRLAATPGISESKRQKVLCALVDTIFDRRFVDESLMSYTISPSRGAFKGIFQKLIEISSIKVGSTSLNKMYDLMIMSLKSQLYSCPRPEDFLLVTINHLDGIQNAIGPNPGTVELLDNIYDIVLKNFQDLTSGQFIVLRQLLLNFFLDAKTKVSVLMKEGLQNENGLVIQHGGGNVPHSCEPPGAIRYFKQDGRTPAREEGSFAVDYRYEPSLPAPSLERHDHRGTKLGLNLYNSPGSSAKPPVAATPPIRAPDASSRNQTGPVDSMVDQATKEKFLRQARAEDELMRKALGEKQLVKGKKPSFDLELDLGFASTDSPSMEKKSIQPQASTSPPQPGASQASLVPNTVADFSKGSRKTYESIWKEFTFDDEDQGDSSGGLADQVRV